MNRLCFHATLALLLAIILAGCKESGKPKTLGEKEIYFDDKLASVSPDGDSACWIGSETGDIWYFSENERRTYNIGTDRIYKVVPDRKSENQPEFWLGIRNSGLQKWTVKDGNPVMLACYHIANKNDKYSVYDIITDGDMVYTATSQGLYSMKRDDTEPALIYPEPSSETARKGKPMMVSSLCLNGNELLACSQDGLIKFNTSTHRITVLHAGIPINSVDTCDGRIYSLADGRLFIDSTNTSALQEIPITFSARYHRKINGTHYFIRSNHIVLSENLREFISVPLRHKVPQFSSNILCTGRRDGFTLLVTENALWHIPQHIGVFNVYGEIVASCSDGDCMYFLNSANELFCMNNGDTTADKIYDLPEGETVSDIMAADGRLYCISNGNCLLGLDVHDSYLQNGLLSKAETVYQSSTKITSACICNTDDGHRVYLGIQDELIAIADDGHADTVTTLSGKYITSFHTSEVGDPVYLSTLNNGVFCGSEKEFNQIENTSDVPFIRDIAVTGEHIPILMMLTSHSLILSESQDTIDAKGFNKLLYVNDSLFYALPETGVREYTVSNGHVELQGEYYGDIHFNPQASFVNGDHIYLGSDIGVLTITAGNISNARWVEFRSDAPNVRMMGVIIGFGILLLVVTAVAVKKRNDSRRRMIRIHIDDLYNRLEGLTAMAAVTGNDEDARLVEELRRETVSLNTKSHNAATHISDLSRRIMRKNRDMGLAISKHLHYQTEAIKNYDSYDRAILLDECHKAMASGDTEFIMEQLGRNAAWLKRMEEVTVIIRDCRNDMAGAQEIDGVNDGLAAETERLADALLHQTLDSLDTELRQLEERYRFVFTDEALKLIDTFIEMRTNLITDVPAELYDDISAALVAQIHDLRSTIKHSKRPDFLRGLYSINCRISQIITRRQLADTMDEYCRMRMNVINDSDRHTSSADSSLEIEIADHTQAITERIEQLISNLYALMNETDATVITDLLRLTDLTKQSARVLALLIARPSTERSLLSGMLGMFGNMSPVISRLRNNKIRPAREQLVAYAKAHPSSMVPYILALA